MRPRLSLRATVTLAALAAVAIGVLLAGAVLSEAIGRDGRRDLDEDLRARAAQLLRRPAPPGRPGPPGIAAPDERSVQARGQGLLGGSGSFVQVAFAGRLIAREGDVPADPPSMPADDGLTTLEIDGEPWRSLTVSDLVRGPAVRVQVLADLDPVEERVASARRLVLLLGLAALAITALAAWGFTTLAVRPLRRLQAGAARVSGARDLAAPLPEDDGPIEVRSLAHALNGMLARLGASTAAMERALQATRRFAADAGHELRTPLTALRANLDALERNPDIPVEERLALVRDMTLEQDRIVHLLEGLQALARGDAADRLPREPFDLGELADAALHGARRRHPGVRFELHENGAAATPDAIVVGWPDGLRLVVDNLLDNAARHGRADGRVRLALSQAAGEVRLRVEDDGPGVPAPERERILEPFVRGGAATAPGTGLGLAIVAQQVALHGGTLKLGQAALGGLLVDVRLPHGGDPSGGPGPGPGTTAARPL